MTGLMFGVWSTAATRFELAGFDGSARAHDARKFMIAEGWDPDDLTVRRSCPAHPRTPFGACPPCGDGTLRGFTADGGPFADLALSLDAGTAADPYTVLALYGEPAVDGRLALDALGWMRHAVLASDVPGAVFGSPLWPRLRPGGEGLLRLEIDLLLGGDRYVYGFTTTGEAVAAEWLHAYPGGTGTRQERLRRTADTLHLDGLTTDGPAGHPMPGERTLCLTANPTHPALAPLHAWFTRNLTFTTADRDLDRRRDQAAAVLCNADARTRRALARLLKIADLGVEDIDLAQDGPRLIHRGTDKSVALPFALESAGTYSLIVALDGILSALAEGTVVVIGDLDRSLHPILTSELLAAFHDLDANPYRAQLLTTLNNPTATRPSGWYQLDPGQIYMLERTLAGSATAVGGLTAEDFLRRLAKMTRPKP